MKTAETAEPIAFLDSPLLAGASDASRVAIFRALAEGRASRGVALLEQGKPNDRLWFVLDGSVAVERSGPGGRVDVLAVLNGPAIYGTTTFFRGTALSATLRASTDLKVGTLDHRAYDQLRRAEPRAAEELALSVVRVLSERFDMLDARLAEILAHHGEDSHRATEWANFRARLFEEPTL